MTVGGTPESPETPPAPATAVHGSAAAATTDVPVVAVTGAGHGLGALVADRLADLSGAARVVGVDGAEEAGDEDADPRLEWRVADVADSSLAGALGGVHSLVHLGAALPPDAPAATRRRALLAVQTVLTAAAAAGVRRVVLGSSAMVYGAEPDNPVPLDEDAPLRALGDGGEVSDLLEVERLAAGVPAAHPGLAVTVLRPAALVGPGVDGVVLRYFAAPRLLVVREAPMRWQFCHVEDLAAAAAWAALERATGVLTVGCEGWLTQADVERMSGLRHVVLPLPVATQAAQRLHRVGVLATPATDLAYVIHPWVVPSTRLRAAGWRPVWDNALAFQALLAEAAARHEDGARRVRRDAVGAAGAAVAAVGTAAMLRRARRRRLR